ncbi:SigB/SigF/SigG family RNA polymerase sigma factor [Nonomuraea aurantiaca]|uniref:SigB/SigF/SigG family RNA polymerase sigma factor n=1 Tax=Nonomuraea aurantiaca TaxID=2878562 RepID=UPI001CDA020B|nr:SigB/SigF/SigG family RNA polymerase sigma factor [Nonomuraea aurantiaca]MCA2222939.1 SigB/SigF/SigG family RNA polymerase sigma factor [Nonomuraea aurantiaca]
MAVLDIPLEQMTAEELLVEMVRPQISEAHKVRLRERLVETHAWMAKSLARRYRNRGEPMEDLLQAAYVGMIKAINGFDAGLGHDFRRYATVTMAGEVKRHFRDRAWAIRVPRVHQERRSKLNRLSADLSQALGRSPTIAELAADMGLSQEDVLLTMDASAAYSALSLDASFDNHDGRGGGHRASLADVLPCADEALDTLIGMQSVKPLIDALPTRDKHILLLRFYGNHTQAEIAAEIGLSQMHVSRILRNVLGRLRTELID